MPDTRCAQCEATLAVTNPDQVRCAQCGLYLILDDVTGEWISPAEHDRRQREARTAQVIEESRIAVGASLAEAAALLPDGWTIETGQIMDGSVHALTVAVPPQPGPADASTEACADGDAIAVASLIPPSDSCGWKVRVCNRVQRVGYPLFTDGGARAAQYATVAAAMNAAVNVLRIELSDPRNRP
jgi:hypothetical protein